MRQLTGHDVFMALKVLQKIGVKDELVDFAVQLKNEAEQSKESAGSKENLQQKLGAKLIFGVLSNCGDEAAEKAFFAFLAGPLESTPQALAAMDLLDLVDMTQEWIGTVDKERWRAFFSSLSGLIAGPTSSTSSLTGMAGQNAM